MLPVKLRLQESLLSQTLVRRSVSVS